MSLGALQKTLNAFGPLLVPPHLFRSGGGMQGMHPLHPLCPRLMVTRIFKRILLMCFAMPTLKLVRNETS